MKIILHISGAVLLLYSTAGIPLQAPAKFEGFGHHCEMLLVSMEDNHLAAYTLPAGLIGTLFFLAKKGKSRRMKRTT